MDKILKNDKIMGIVAITTLVLVGLIYWKNHKSTADVELPVE